MSQQLAHMVFFKLKDSSQENLQKLVDECGRFLKQHDGVVYYSAGTHCKELAREVNDKDFDVALHMIFSCKKSHDEYQVSPNHQDFIDRNNATWAKVRVFDSYV